MGAPISSPREAASRALVHAAHVERFAYERQGVGLDASPHLLAGATRLLVAATLPDMAPPASSPQEDGWGWWSGSSDEWYEHGPFASRDEALGALEGAAGFIVEALPPARITLDAADLLMSQYFEENETFDYDRAEPERLGRPAEIALADADLQALLDGWAARHAHTFARGSLFAGTRNAEQIEATVSEEIAFDRDGPR